jgi:hypothetical protein
MRIPDALRAGNIAASWEITKDMSTPARIAINGIT